MRGFLIIFFNLALIPSLLAQYEVKGRVVNEEYLPIPGVNVVVKNTNHGTVTDKAGRFVITAQNPDSLFLQFTHVSYFPEERQVFPLSGVAIEVTMELSVEVLQSVEVQGITDLRGQPGMYNINPISIAKTPTPFGDFNAILKTLPGVVSNNELSSAYSVRGGSFDENLVEVNGIPVYRPFIISNGQQEGLSFVNPAFTENINFSSGGWQSRYGEKLSSVLDITYRKPREFSMLAEGGLLGGQLSAEGGGKKVSWIAGVRRKSSKYLLNTFHTKGEYLPRFTDFQLFLTYHLSSKTTITSLSSFAHNRYYVEPASRETEFGTFNKSFRLLVAFDGAESMDYDTWQTGINLEHELSDRWTMNFILSAVDTREKEYIDLEGGYRLCDVDKKPGSSSYDECIVTRGIGTQYSYARNRLAALITNARMRSNHSISSRHQIEWGLAVNSTTINDHQHEYSFIDSAGYVTSLDRAMGTNLLDHQQGAAYVQHSVDLTPALKATYGLRGLYTGATEELLFSPRAQVSWRPGWKRDVLLKVASGIYRQPLFFRELYAGGSIVEGQKHAQSSFHLTGGFDYNLSIWQRAFKWTGEAYYKYLWNVAAYDIDNVRIRYLLNETYALAYGLDTRLSGEFIPGTESWFSLGLLKAREDVIGDEKGYIRRPMDQAITFGALFQDHFPNNPSLRVALNLLFGSGLPFGPPGSLKSRNAFNGDMYRRVDLRFTKAFERPRTDYMLSVEVLNLLGAENAITYTWIKDVLNQQIAVPNSLSMRFFNVKIRVVI